ncbi:hypothetical protein M9H77_23016 [Catharanthus roseus]|uniref:Uncharacterized protein n=1 Tax=Catharanthus roseus TaxID=4058 RepID=A0ACC0AUT5_CATRO|nr:hypothetical protein M9H77_23016 [Catharanthus roseus]
MISKRPLRALPSNIEKNIRKHTKAVTLRSIKFLRRHLHMTWDEYENMEIFQGPVTRSMARNIEKENKEIVALLEKDLQDGTWNALEGEDDVD